MDEEKGERPHNAPVDLPKAWAAAEMCRIEEVIPASTRAL